MAVEEKQRTIRVGFPPFCLSPRQRKLLEFPFERLLCEARSEGGAESKAGKMGGERGRGPRNKKRSTWAGLSLSELGACGWTKSSSSSFSSRAGGRKSSLSILVLLFSLSLAESSGTHGGPSSLTFVGASASTRESGTLPGDRRRRPRTCRQCARCARGSRGARPELGAVVLWSTRTKGSRDSLSFSFIGFYVQMTVGRRLSGYNRIV